LAAASKPCIITDDFQSIQRTVAVAILTVVGSSKKINVGLAINASAALNLRLFPPLDIRKIELYHINHFFEIVKRIPKILNLPFFVCVKTKKLNHFSANARNIS
jgi:hypothetical protein